MRPINPKYEDTVKLVLRVSERTNEILTQYSKFTKYEIDEIINEFASEIIKDDERFVKWLGSRRYNKKIKERIFGVIEIDAEDDSPSEEEKCQTENQENLQTQAI